MTRKQARQTESAPKTKTRRQKIAEFLGNCGPDEFLENKCAALTWASNAKRLRLYERIEANDRKALITALAQAVR